MLLCGACHYPAGKWVFLFMKIPHSNCSSGYSCFMKRRPVYIRNSTRYGKHLSKCCPKFVFPIFHHANPYCFIMMLLKHNCSFIYQVFSATYCKLEVFERWGSVWKFSIAFGRLISDTFVNKCMYVVLGILLVYCVMDLSYCDLFLLSLLFPNLYKGPIYTFCMLPVFFSFPFILVFIWFCRKTKP